MSAVVVEQGSNLDARPYPKILSLPLALCEVSVHPDTLEFCTPGHERGRAYRLLLDHINGITRESA